MLWMPKTQTYMTLYFSKHNMYQYIYFPKFFYSFGKCVLYFPLPLKASSGAALRGKALLTWESRRMVGKAGFTSATHKCKTQKLQSRACWGFRIPLSWKLWPFTVKHECSGYVEQKCDQLRSYDCLDLNKHARYWCGHAPDMDGEIYISKALPAALNMSGEEKEGCAGATWFVSCCHRSFT